MDFNSPQFARQYHYDGGDLGARLTDTGTRFACGPPRPSGCSCGFTPKGWFRTRWNVWR